MAALTNCSQLRILFLSSSMFGGVLPDSLSNLSTSITYLSLETNKISGNIPKDIGNLINLQALTLGNNYFTGDLPSSIGRLQNLQLLSAANNTISGSIPSTLGNLTELNILELESNAFSGSIPSMVRNLTNLLALSLANNNFTGQVPSGIFCISTLSKGMDLSHNNLNGPIPPEIGNLKNIAKFHAESNKLSGEIPTTLGECQLLQNVYLQNNIFSGTVPSLLSQLKGLQTLDISNHNLSGQIPKFLTNLTMLHYLNLSFNSFAGEVPTISVFSNASAISIQGNDKAIVFEFMPNGSLEGWLHPDTNEETEHRYLNLLERVTILFDVAYALDYLHCHGPAPVVHCDIKSSNVLLDADMVAHVGDFGLAKILVERSTFLQQSAGSMGLRGTIGYAAPGYGAGNMVSTQGDRRIESSSVC